LSHRAAIYKVEVYRRHNPKDSRLLGNFDKSGTALATAINGYFKANTFTHASDDGTRSVICGTSSVVGDEVRSVFAHGETGVIADIVNDRQQLQFRLQQTHTQLVNCASLFYLEPNEKIGWWAVHSNNRRSAKGLIHAKLLELFKDGYDDLTLSITPVVPGDALTEAVKKNLVDSITLVRHEDPSDAAALQASGKWLKKSDVGTIELRIKPGDRLKSALLKKFLKDGDRAAFGDIVAFEGITFDEAKVQVELDDGNKRIFNIEKPEAGHAFTTDLQDLKFNDAGEPTDASLYKSLRRVIDSVA
jgi:hypothetical protein